MSRIARDEEREMRIDTQAIPDADKPGEKAMSWHVYLSDSLPFPFAARSIKLYTSSPLERGDIVKVIKMAPEEECERDMLVLVRWKRREFTVPLDQLEGMGLDEENQEALKDWHYWVKRGRKL